MNHAAFAGKQSQTYPKPYTPDIVRIVNQGPHINPVGTKAFLNQSGFINDRPGAVPGRGIEEL